MLMPSPDIYGYGYNISVLRTSENAYNYVFDPAKGRLTAFQPDGQRFGQYDLKAAKPSLFLEDFVPFGSDSIVFLDSGNIFQYDLSTHTLTQLSSPQPPQKYTYFVPCNLNNASFNQKRDIMRVGTTNSVVLCYSKPDPTSQYVHLCGITILDVATKKETDLFTIICMIGTLDFGSAAGADGKIYIDADQKLANQLAPGLVPDGSTDRIYLRYDLQTAKWDAVVIAANDAARLLGILVAVDVNSNLYFYWRKGSDRTPFQIAKVASSGHIDWILTDHDLPDTVSFAGVTGDGQLILVSNTTSNTSDAQVQNSTLIPATPTAVQ